jgi:preprotein translocase subunit Sss1
MIPELRNKPGDKMNLEEQIVQVVEQAVKSALEGLKTAEKPKGEETTGLLKTAQAGKLLACSAEYIRMLQDRGDLELIFLPGSNHRRVLKSEILELIEKSKVKRVIKKAK